MFTNRWLISIGINHLPRSKIEKKNKQTNKQSINQSNKQATACSFIFAISCQFNGSHLGFIQIFKVTNTFNSISYAELNLMVL